MIFDAITNKKDISIKCIRDGVEETISDILSWRMSDQHITDMDIIINFNESITLKKIDFNIISGTLPKVKLFYSYDGNSWNDFVYISYTINSLDTLPSSLTLSNNVIASKIDIESVLKKYENKIMSLFVHTSERQPLEGFNNTKDIPTKQYYKKHVFGNGTNDSMDNEILNHFLLGCYLNQDSSINIYYPFLNKEAHLYNEFNFNYLKLTLQDFSIDDNAPDLYFTRFIVDISQEINNLDMSISPFVDNLFKQKAYTENSFLHDITKTFFDMLEISP